MHRLLRWKKSRKGTRKKNNKLQELIAAQAAALDKAMKRIEELERKVGSGTRKISRRSVVEADVSCRMRDIRLKGAQP